MIETTKCRHCRQAYEITWNDVDVDEWRDDFDDDSDSDFNDENSDPVYCPFCGCHMDSTDESW